jgi:hypothetical protein
VQNTNGISCALLSKFTANFCSGVAISITCNSVILVLRNLRLLRLLLLRLWQLQLLWLLWLQHQLLRR